MKEDEPLLRLILDSLPVAVRLIDRHKRSVIINKASHEIWGKIDNGQPINFPPSLDAWWLESGKKLEKNDWTGYRALVTGNHCLRDLIKIRTSSGEDKVISNSAVPIKDQANEVTGVVIITEDITERTHLQQIIGQTQRMESLGSLAANIAHDFRSSLGLILATVTLLEKQTSKTPSVTRHTDSIRKITHQSLDLIDRILSFTKATDMNWEAVQIQDFLRELAFEFSKTLPESIRMEISVDPSIPAIIADRGQLQQMILNLCKNAVEAISNQGLITIQTCPVPGSYLKQRGHAAEDFQYLKLSVTDTGMGMDISTQQKIFEPFFTTKTTSGGSGLGLSSAYGTIKRHGGFVEVESTLNLGTSFQIYFPYVPPDTLLRASPTNAAVF